jgi:PTS system nitrogen regulatory IIA component
MKISDLLAPENVLLDVKATDKNRLLRLLAKHAATATSLDEDRIATAMLEREELGSTGVGNGVALPHARLDGIKVPLGLLARLRRSIDFESVDDEPVDIVLMLLLPESANGDQLNALACAARALRDPGTLAQMRSATNHHALHRAATE